MEDKQNKLSVPVSIVVAGILIAGAVYLSNTESKKPTANVEQEQTTETTNSLSLIRGVVSDDHILGNPDAEITLIEYSDMECPFCKSFHYTLRNIISEYGTKGTVAWVYRHFPIPQLHPKAPKEAEATECVYEQGGNSAFWTFLDSVFDTTKSNNTLTDGEIVKLAGKAGVDTKIFNECLDSGKYSEKVQRDFNEAVSAGGNGTPFTVMILKEKLTDAETVEIEKITSQFPQNTVRISEDSKRIGLSGALPENIIKRIIDVILN